MRIVGRWAVPIPPNWERVETVRHLECGHCVTEPDGGRARLAERAHCPKCAPKRAQRPQPPRGATNVTKPGIESGPKTSRNGDAVRAVATNRASVENGGRT
jgi:hypothetical protein